MYIYNIFFIWIARINIWIELNTSLFITRENIIIEKIILLIIKILFEQMYKWKKYITSIFFLNFHKVKNNFFFINNDIYYSYIREYIKILKRNILCSNYCVNKYYSNIFHIYVFKYNNRLYIIRDAIFK